MTYVVVKPGIGGFRWNGASTENLRSSILRSQYMDPKIGQILRVLFVAFLVIGLRVASLVSHREEKLAEALAPKQRSLLLKPDRGSIVDRSERLLALNQIRYEAAVYYGEIAEIPVVKRVTLETGERVKAYPRREYVARLAALLASELDLDATRLEDLIHSKASLFPHLPYVVKSNLSENEHYRLRALEKDYPGLSSELASIRSYPMGPVGCHVVGMLGAINQEEYLRLASEMNMLQETLELYEQEGIEALPPAYSSIEEVGWKLGALKEQSYGMNDSIGKGGVERAYERQLRGFAGKKVLEVDHSGHAIAECPLYKEPIPGTRLRLSISLELQKFAEELLIADEQVRRGRSYQFDPVTRARVTLKQPWIKGGAIVAMNPRTGEIVALASYPRFNPNDFIKKRSSEVNRWLENEAHIGALWDGRDQLKREKWTPQGVVTETQEVSWDFFLAEVLPTSGSIKSFFEAIRTVKQAVQLQEDVEAMHYFGASTAKEVKRRVEAVLNPVAEVDRPFALSLLRLVAPAPCFSDALLKEVGGMSLSDFRKKVQEYLSQEEREKEQERIRFHHEEFARWREANGKAFLAEKREREKARKTYARPYLDYLDAKERTLFEQFWKEKRLEKGDFARVALSYWSLDPEMKRLAALFYPKGGFGFIRSNAYQVATPIGSVFKLAVAYEALMQGKNPTLSDYSLPGPDGVIAVGADGTRYMRHYKGGRLPRTAHVRGGQMDLVGAIEQSSNPYFSILAGDYFSSPLDLCKAARTLGFGSKTGIDLKAEFGGRLPNDLLKNKTGLYSAAIGQHTLLATPLQAALMLGAIENGGTIWKPGVLAPSIERQIEMPEEVRGTLLKAMDRVVRGEKGGARPSVIKALKTNPNWMRHYLALQQEMVGKTGTAEFLYKASQNPSAKAEIYKNIWFGAIDLKTPLVVVVYLRYGDSGKEAAPLAAEVIGKWRELLEK